MRQRERTVHARQAGVSLMGLIIGLVIFAVVALFGMKVVPSYLEFRAARGAIQSLAREKQAAGKADIQRAFESRTAVGDITSIKAQDLNISKQGNEWVISFAYRKEVPLFTASQDPKRGVALCIDYAAITGGQ